MTDLQRQFIEASARVILERKAVTRVQLWRGDGHDAREQAAMFLGALQQANGCELEEIVRAASEANTFDGVNSTAINLREFARIITLQALGEPVRWEDEHEAFAVMAPVFQQYTERHALSVPRINLTTAGA